MKVYKYIVLFLILSMNICTYAVGGRVVDSDSNDYYITSPYDGNDLFDIQYVQSADQMFLAHEDYPIYALVRETAGTFALSQWEIPDGPFLSENEDEDITITCSDVTLTDYYDAYTTGDNSQGVLRSTQWEAQTFTASASYDVNSIKLKVWKTGTPGNLIVSIKATATGSPDGNDLAAGYSSATTFTTDTGGAWITVDMNAPYSLVSGTTYAIVARSPTSDTSNSIYWREDATTPTYSGGSYGASTNSGSSWTMYTQTDKMFAVIDVNDVVAASDMTMTATGDIWDANHINALWELVHVIPSSSVQGQFWQIGSIVYYDFSAPELSWQATDDSNSITIREGQSYDFSTHGVWSGIMVLQRSYDNGTTWEDVYLAQSDNDSNVQYSGTETNGLALYRVHMDTYNNGYPKFILTSRSFLNHGIVKIESYVDANEVTASINPDYPVYSTDATYRWSEGAFSAYQGYPKTIAFYEERLCLGGTTLQPETIWFSETGNWDSFREGPDALDAFHVTVASDQVNTIQWMSGQSSLVVGTSAGEWIVAAGKQALGFYAGNRIVRRQSHYGSEHQQSIAMDNDIVYLQRNGRKVRKTSYAVESDSWVSPELTLLSEHITESGIKDWGYQRTPIPMLWCVRNDGEIALLTLEENNDVLGWTRQVTDGDFKSVAVIPGTNEDRVWFAVERDVNGTDYTYIEQLQPFDWGDDQSDAFFVDCGLTYDGGDEITITGVTQADPAVVTAVGHGLSDGDNIRIWDVSGMTELNNNVYSVGTVVDVNSFQLRDSTDAVDINSVNFTAYTSSGSLWQVENTFTTVSHLDGEEVILAVEGGYYGTEDVDANTITLSDYFNKVHAGLPYTAKLKPMKIDLSSSPGALLGTRQRISEVYVRLYKSLACDIGTSWTDYDSLLFRDADDPLEAPSPLFTGDKSLYFRGPYGRTSDIYIQNRYPVPLSILALRIDYEANE